MINRNAILAGGIKPHYYCLPVAKREKAIGWRCARRRPPAIRRFFLGTDSAPHVDPLKECACGCAGIFTAINTLSCLAHVFEEEGRSTSSQALPVSTARLGTGFRSTRRPSPWPAFIAGLLARQDRDRRRAGDGVRPDGAHPLGSCLSDL
jgi:hypothetical protein